MSPPRTHSRSPGLHRPALSTPAVPLPFAKGSGRNKVVISRSRVVTVRAPSPEPVACGYRGWVRCKLVCGERTELRAESGTTSSDYRVIARAGGATISRLRTGVQADRNSRPTRHARIAMSHSTCRGSEPAVTRDAAQQEHPALPPPRSLPPRGPRDLLP